MAAQLTGDPIIKITLTSNEVFDEVAPGYVCDKFRLTKGLLVPNKFEFILRKESLAVEPSDITFELRKKLLAAMVEVKLQARRHEGEELKEYEVEDFFYGYIQNIQVFRENGGAVKFKCTAYSPDAKMKHHPANNTYIDTGLLGVVAAVTSFNAFEHMAHFDKKEGKYDTQNNCLETEINLSNDSSNCERMPYTVQYNESPYDFLKRLAKRYAEFMYYEDRKFHFGAMKELPEIHLHTGSDLAEYFYEMNMNDHNGIVYTKFDTFRGVKRGVGVQKKGDGNQNAKVYTCKVDEDDYQNEMALSAYETASDYFGDYANSLVELGAQPLFDENVEEMEDSVENRRWYSYQHYNLDRYVLSDSLICRGKADRVDLKLGSVIVIEDDAKTGAEKEETVAHKPLKVIELSYYWDKEENNLDVKNRFKAIPQEAKVPPYLERDKDGFLVYGDIDVYPKSGPQYGSVVDNRDPENLGRVRVALGWQVDYGFILNSDNYKDWDYLKDTYNLTPWIWVVSPYQGRDHGSMAVPEIGDMVLVGFEHNNVERPYVMGSRYFKPYGEMNSEWTRFEKNRVKGFRSRSGHTIEIIDREGDLKDGQEEYKKGGRIHIYDAKTHAYDILFDTDQKLIKLVSKGNIELHADNDIIMEAGNDISMDAGNDFYLKADNNGKVFINNDFSEWTGNNKSTREGGGYSHYTTKMATYQSGEDMYVESGGDLSVVGQKNGFYTVKKNFNKDVGGDAFATIKGKLSTQVNDNENHLVKKKYFMSCDEITQKAEKDLKLFANNCDIKAMNGIKINATSSIDLKAPSIKEN